MSERRIIGEGSVPSFGAHMKLRFNEQRRKWVIQAPEKVFEPDETAVEILKMCDGKTSVGGIVDADEKKATVERVCAELGISPKQAIVMGDGANDLKMMSISGLSVAFRAKPVVRAQADVALNFVGLDGVLNLLS